MFPTPRSSWTRSWVRDRQRSRRWSRVGARSLRDQSPVRANSRATPRTPSLRATERSAAGTDAISQGLEVRVVGDRASRRRGPVEQEECGVVLGPGHDGSGHARTRSSSRNRHDRRVRPTNVLSSSGSDTFIVDMLTRLPPIGKPCHSGDPSGLPEPCGGDRGQTVTEHRWRSRVASADRARVLPVLRCTPSCSVCDV